MMNSGRPPAVIITLPAAAAFANACSNCGGRAERIVTAALKINRTTKTYSIPSCNACANRASKHGSKRVLFGLLTVVAAVGLAIPAFPLREHGFVAFALSMLGAVALAFLLFVVLKSKPVLPPATSDMEAVRLTAWNYETSWFYCTNPDWAAHTAQLSGGQIAPAAARPYRPWGFIVLAVGGTFAAAAMCAAIARPTVVYRNSTDKPLAFYVDGKRQSVVVQPNSHHSGSETYGTHTIGWSAPEADKPVKTIAAEVKLGQSHMVNPDEGGCFWLNGAGYGTSKVDEKKLGPLPLQSFYTFDHVDLWFQELPKTVSTKSSGETRIAVQVYPLCEKALKVCERDKVKAALLCDAKAATSEEGETCWEPCGYRPKSDKHVDDSEIDKDIAKALALSAATPVDAGARADAGAGAKKTTAKPKGKSK